MTTLCIRRFGLNPMSLLKAVMACAAVSLALAGCAPKKSEQIIIRGSNTIGEELAPKLISEYTKSHPTVTFDTEFKGTSYGLGALMAQRCDIGAASREVTTNEESLGKDNGVELKEHVIGAYSVAVVVNSANPVSNLTTNQVRDIFSGVIQNWKELGGPDAPIHLYIRNPISGTYLGFQEVAMEKKAYAIGAKALTSHIEVAQAVTKDQNGIGYSSIDLAQQTGVKAVSIEGVKPSVETVNKGQYPYARVLRLYTNKTKESPTAGGFVQFVQSAEGQKILAEMGFVPHP
jgi:phosphate transport system substrate-binding protein